MSSLAQVGQWLGNNAVWLIPAVLTIVTGWQVKSGSNVRKVIQSGLELHEAAKKAHFDDLLDVVANAEADVALMVPVWDKKLSEADEMLFGLRKGATKAERQRTRDLVKKHESR